MNRHYQASPIYIGVDHITATRPPCSECKAPACTWQRCKCRVYFARCENHQPSAVAEMRRSHVCDAVLKLLTSERRTT